MVPFHIPTVETLSFFIESVQETFVGSSGLYSEQFALMKGESWKRQHLNLFKVTKLPYIINSVDKTELSFLFPIDAAPQIL